MNEIVRINLDDYKVIKFIGSGSFGKVYLIENKNTFIQYAAKETEKQDENRLIENDFYREIKSLSKTNNHSILNLIGYSLQNFKKKQCPTMVLEYMKNGSLEQNLLKKSKEFTRNKYIILLGIALGMKYLHSLGIIHRDLKPQNILLDDNFQPKISDFGTCFISDKELSKIQLEDSVGTLLYMAPEIFSHEPYSYKVDVYAFSLVFYQLLTGKTPFNGYKKKLKLVHDIKNGKRPELPENLDKNIREFIEKCWSNDPSERPPFSEIVEELYEIIRCK